jgi:hypothetical protein
MEATMCTVTNAIEIALCDSVWAMTKTKNGKYYKVYSLAELGEDKRFLHRRDAELYLWKCRVWQVLVTSYWMDEEYVKKIIRQELRKPRRPSFQTVVYQHAHWKYSPPRAKSDASQKSNVIKFPTPPNEVARDL